VHPQTVNDGVAEVQMGKPAVEKASNPQVKQFGQSMIDDHTKAGDQLKSVASKDNITLPADLNAKDKATYDSLSKLSGTAFDRAYMRDMVKDHQTDVNEFQKEANFPRCTTISGWLARRTTPCAHEAVVNRVLTRAAQ